MSAFFWPLAPGSPSHRGPLQVLPTSSSLLTKAFLSVAAALLIPRLTVAPSHRYQPFAVGAAVHAGCTRGARADMRMGQAGPCHFGQPPRSGQSVGESGQAVHSFRAALVEDPDRHQGHTGTKEQRSTFSFTALDARSRTVKLWSAATVVTWEGGRGRGNKAESCFIPTPQKQLLA